MGEFDVEFLKTVYHPSHNMRRENRLISTYVYATTTEFEQKHIQKDHGLEWACPITYPLDGVRHAIQCLGKIEANIPHEKLFPPGSAVKAEARFRCSIRRRAQLLRLEFFLKEDGKENLFYPLQKTFIAGALWSDESEGQSQVMGFKPSPHMNLWPRKSKPGRKPKRKPANPGAGRNKAHRNSQPSRRSIWAAPGNDDECLSLVTRKRARDIFADSTLPPPRKELHRPIRETSQKDVCSQAGPELAKVIQPDRVHAQVHAQEDGISRRNMSISELVTTPAGIMKQKPIYKDQPGLMD